MSHVAYVCNQTFSWSIPDGTPYQKWTGQKPDLSTIQEFGTDIWVLNPDPQRNNLAPKSNWFIFVGYQDSPWAIQYYDHSTQIVKLSRNYHFLIQPAQPLHVPECQPEGEQCTRSRQAFDTAPEQVLEPNYGTGTKWKLFETTTKQDEWNVHPRIEPDGESDDLLDLADDLDSDDDKESWFTEQVYASLATLDVGNKDPMSLKEAKESPECQNIYQVTFRSFWRLFPHFQSFRNVPMLPELWKLFILSEVAYLAIAYCRSLQACLCPSRSEDVV